MENRGGQVNRDLRPFTHRWLVLMAVAACAASADGGPALHDDFGDGRLDGWKVREGNWSVREGRAVAEGAFSVLLHESAPRRDVELSADVAYSHPEAHAAAGLLFRFREDATGYAVCLREVEKGTHPRFGPWERPVLQLFRFDPDGWKLLQESKVMGCRVDLPRRVKVVCQGPCIWVFYEDMAVPVLREFDDRYDRPGAVGLWKDHRGTGRFDAVRIADVRVTPPAPAKTDWSWVRGAVYVRSNAVNSVEMWHDYDGHVDVVDRELACAAAYGFNMVQVYLHWIVWDRHREKYLDRIDDFLGRAARHGLKANLILWDDCGHVEPALTFAAPVPGRHNSQMMPNPSHRIRESAAGMTAHRDRFRGYVEGVVGRFKSDDRIVFWQLYNEGMGPKEQYRIGEGDANLNRLLGWTRDWVKGTGTRIPVTATGGAFYGPKYSDFYTYHAYSDGTHPLPGADGGPEHLCTETLNRPGSTLLTCLKDLAGKQNGFVVWELMIGRDNCRYPWGNPDGLDEPAVPFHGVLYPDGHPWDVREIEALLGDDAFAALQKRVFRVEYFDGPFRARKKTSITPRIDFDLGDEPGTGSPDASAGIGKDDFAIRWTGRGVAPAAGAYTFLADCDGILRLAIDRKPVIDKTGHGRREVTGRVELDGGAPFEIRVDYVHRSGEASAHLRWSGPGFERRVLLPGERTATK
jgi:hypothetical protein